MAAARTRVTLDQPPRLMPALAKGVVTGIGKHPHAGAALPSTRLALPPARADAAEAAAYARVCGFPAPDGRTGLPITYPHILGFPLAARLMSARSFPLPLLGLVHTAVEITRHEPLNLTSLLQLSVYAEELIPHRRGTEAVLITEAHHADRLVWRDRSTYLARHRTTAPRATPSPPETPELPIRAEWQLPAGLGRRYAAVCGDYNPIHLHPLTARPLGFPRAIAHGMWTIARCAAEAVPADAPAVRISAEFRAPVLLPSAVSYAREGDCFQLRGGPGDQARIHLCGKVDTR